MKILVTGCAGFIGSHVCEALLSRGDEVVGIDCFTPFYSREIKMRNLAGFRRDITFYDMDLRTANLQPLLAGVDAVLHIAGQPGVRSCWGADFSEYVGCNIMGTQRLLDAMVETAWMGRLVFTSTSAVYGNARRIPIREGDLCDPVSPYGVTKLAAEQLIRCYAEGFGVDAVILRLFTVYGPRQRPDMAVSRFIEAIRRGSDVVIYGDGTQVREFTYVSDVVGAILLALDAQTSSIPPVFNIGGGERCRVLPLAEQIAEIMGLDLSESYLPMSAGEMWSNEADTARARVELGWHPVVSMAHGLRAQVEWQCTESR